MYVSCFVVVIKLRDELAGVKVHNFIRAVKRERHLFFSLSAEISPPLPGDISALVRRYPGPDAAIFPPVVHEYKSFLRRKA